MELEKLQQGLKLIRECKDKFKELELYYTSELSDIETSISNIINRQTCSHSFTRTEHNHDSHYDYEDVICIECGKELSSKKI